eukprot:7246585-Alexandrium_andersonii.AAC.1
MGLSPPEPWIEAAAHLLQGDPWIHRCIAAPAIPWAFQWIMTNSSNGWHEDMACAAVMTPLDNWTNDEVMRFM